MNVFDKLHAARDAVALAIREGRLSDKDDPWYVAQGSHAAEEALDRGLESEAWVEAWLRTFEDVLATISEG